MENAPRVSVPTRLVLLDNPDFADGLGLRVHIRTTRVKYYSYIERIAVSIGSEVLEFANSVDTWLLNGKQRPDKHSKFAGYQVKRLKKHISIRFGGEGNPRIELWTRKNGMPYVVVDGGKTELFKGSHGLLGDWSTGTKVARDGETILDDAETYALEWQVRDTEPMLFDNARYPQFPTVCVPPKKRLGNRLGDSHMRKAAEKVCAAWEEDKDECIFDAMATRDLSGVETFGLEVDVNGAVIVE